MVLGVDISAEALLIANRNKESLRADNTSFKEMNILDETPNIQFDLLVSNPPYIPKIEMNGLMKDVGQFEPAIALTDEDDGLTFYKRFENVGTDLVKPGGWIILEVGLGKHPSSVKNLFIESRYNHVELVKDYNGDNRVLIAQVK
jgi:release factor glutamine methyltransferase